MTPTDDTIRTMTDLPEGETKRASVRAMFDRIAPRYDLLNRLLTFGLDRRWRRRALAAVGVGPGDTVVDLASGTGDLCELAVARGATCIGVDMSAGMLAHARRRAHERASLVQAYAAALPLPASSADVVTSGFALRNFVSLAGVIAEAARVLRPGGRITLLDVATPEGRLTSVGHDIWFSRIVPKIGAAISDADAYAYLPASLSYLPETAALTDMIADAGFVGIERRTLSAGIVQLFTALRSGR